MKVYKFINTEDEKCFIINKDAFEDANFCECYGNYGQQVGCTNAGCYTFSNEYADITVEFIKELNAKFNLEIEEKYHSIADESDLKDMFEDYEIDFKREYFDFYNEYKEENENHTDVIAYTYWDGSNHTSLVSCNMYEAEADVEELDEDEQEKILKAFEKYDTYIQNGFSQGEEIDGYGFSNSRMQDDFAIAWVESTHENKV